MIFRQFFDRVSCTYTYLLACTATNECVLIDPVSEHTSAYLQSIKELGLTLTVAVDTHVHADHITALGQLREQSGCETILGQEAKVECASRWIKDGDLIRFGEMALKAIYTPGHTSDSYCYLLADMVFTGDTLLIRGTGRTDFQNGCASAQYDSLIGKLLCLPDETKVYPGHDYRGQTCSTIGEERRFNPRLKGGDKAAYVKLMSELRLPNPKLMDVAVPANKSCGAV